MGSSLDHHQSVEYRAWQQDAEELESNQIVSFYEIRIPSL